MDNQAVNVMTALPEVEPVQSAPAASLLTTVQWLICAVACLGFVFDLYEGLMLPLIVRPLLIDLGQPSVGLARVQPLGRAAVFCADRNRRDLRYDRGLSD